MFAPPSCLIKKRGSGACAADVDHLTRQVLDWAVGKLSLHFVQTREIEKDKVGRNCSALLKLSSASGKRFKGPQYPPPDNSPSERV